MTITEAAQAGIEWLRLPQWNESARMKIDIIGDGHGPWGHLYDRETQKAIGEPTPQHFLIVGDKHDTWVETDEPS